MRSRPSANTSSLNLPANFVDSLRVLFDILDTSRAGLVSIEQISDRWQSLPKANLPPGFLECLRRVTPPDGFLTFERFMAGFRLALFNRQTNGRLQRVRSEGKLDETGLKPPTMGINGLLAEQKRRQNANYASNSHYQQHANALRALNASQPSLLMPAHKHNSTPLTLQMEHEDVNGNYGPLLRRPASAGAANKRADLSNGCIANYSVIMRDKKISSTNSNTNSSTTSSLNGSHLPSQMPAKTVRAPLPPQSQNANYAAITKSPPMAVVNNGLASRFRPVSMTSSGSGSCSSGMAEVRWRDSRMSSSNSPPDPIHRQYAEELQPQVAKHGVLLDEETEVIERGLKVTRSLLQWYEDRMESLQKRRRMLEKGMVALDSAVHEQKLNFHRAQITELNRRMTALMNTTKRGFPSHENMQICEAPPIRNAVRPTLINGNGAESQVTPQFLIKQNQKLAEELDAKSHMIEQLKREKRLADLRNAAQFSESQHPQIGKQKIQNGRRPAACVKPAISNYVAMPIKVHDTLL